MSSDLTSSPYVEHVATLAGHESPISGLEWSGTGHWLASCSVDGVLNLWSPPKIKHPRVALRGRIPARSEFTAVAWSPDSQYVACSSARGWVDIWESGSFRAMDHPDDERGPAIRCLAWSTASDGERRLVYGGDSGKLHFRNYDDWREPDRETGIGHESAILSVAWAEDGAVVVSGTADGVIGVWQPSTIDNQLRSVLTWSGIRAHNGAVNSLAWSAETAVLASGGADGRLLVWNVRDNVLLDELKWGEEILDLTFAAGGSILVAQTRDYLRFVRMNPFREIASYDLPAGLDPASQIAIDHNARLAVLDEVGGSTIGVWRIDFDGLLKASELTKRSFSAVGVSLLGPTGSGRTNLGLALAGHRFVESSPQHPFDVYRLPVASAMPEQGVEHVREIAVWDLPSREDHALVQRMHAGDGAVALMVLPVAPDSLLTDKENLDEWQRDLRRWKAVSRTGTPALLPVITKCDELRRAPKAGDMAAVERALGVERLFLTSTKSGSGISELLAAIKAAVDWTSAVSFPSVEGFAHVRQFIARMRKDCRYLTSVSELYSTLGKELRFLSPLVRGPEQIKAAMQLLETIGEVQFFDDCDEVLLDTSLYHAYAAAMIAAAGSDSKGMGRLPEREARRGFGKQLTLPTTAVHPDPKERTRILGLTIGELIGRGAAQLVSTDGESYVVFPMTAGRVTEPGEGEAAIRARFVGPAREAFASLLVRFLGLSDEYPRHDISANHGSFTTAAGGLCTVRSQIHDGGDEAELSVYFSDQTTEAEQGAFANKVRRHLQERGDVSGQLDGWTPVRREPVVAGGQGGPEVFFSWSLDESDSTTIENVAHIARELRAQHVGVFGDRAIRLGETRHDRDARIDNTRVAVVLLAGAPTEAQEIECDRLARTGCRIITVILPNTKRTFKPPTMLDQFGVMDFRKRLADFSGLVQGIREAWEAGPRPLVENGWIFLSYVRDDKERVSPFRRDLERANHRVWWDGGHGDLPPGQSWPQEVSRAINGSYAFLVCFSARAVARGYSYVYSEIDEAIRIQRMLRPDRRFIVPVRLSECEIPPISIDASRTLNSLQRFDYFGRNRRLAELIRVLDTNRRERQILPDTAPA